jgi:hypothetical protein
MMLSAAASLFVQMVVMPRLTVQPFILLRISMPMIFTAFATAAGDQEAVSAWVLISSAKRGKPGEYR